MTLTIEMAEITQISQKVLHLNGLYINAKSLNNDDDECEDGVEDLRLCNASPV